MAQPLDHQPVRPVLGMLSRRPGLFDRALDAVAARWGAPDLVSDLMDFDFTDYYTPDMGPGLKRKLCSFPVPMDPAVLPEIKLWTNSVERDIARSAQDDYPRPVNLDPGYITDAKLVLATTKDHAHRIYLGQGIYAEITLAYRNGAWRNQPWTYADFRTAPYHRFFLDARALLMRARRP